MMYQYYGYKKFTKSARADHVSTEINVMTGTFAFLNEKLQGKTC